MPVADAALYLFDGVAADAAGDILMPGVAPIDGMLLRVMSPTGTTGNYTVEQSDTLAFTTSGTIEVGGAGAFVAGETVLRNVLWSRKYLRATLDTTAGGGAVNISLVIGRWPSEQAAVS